VRPDLVAGPAASRTVTVTPASSWVSPVTAWPSRRLGHGETEHVGAQHLFDDRLRHLLACLGEPVIALGRQPERTVEVGDPRPDRVSQKVTRCDQATGSGAAARSASATPHRGAPW
jgi:hypothetical protein